MGSLKRQDDRQKVWAQDLINSRNTDLEIFETNSWQRNWKWSESDSMEKWMWLKKKKKKTCNHKRRE